MLPSGCRGWVDNDTDIQKDCRNRRCLMAEPSVVASGVTKTLVQPCVTGTTVATTANNKPPSVVQQRGLVMTRAKELFLLRRISTDTHVHIHMTDKVITYLKKCGIFVTLFHVKLTPSKSFREGRQRKPLQTRACQLH